MTGPAVPNAELAYRVLDHIDAHPEQHHQDWWLKKGECGTQACFAGLASLLSGDRLDIPADAKVGDLFEFVTTPDGEGFCVNVRAELLLGVTEEQADELFYACNTREDLGRLVAEIFGPRPEPEPCGASLSARCFNGELGCPTHPQRARFAIPADDVPPNAGSAS